MFWRRKSVAAIAVVLLVGLVLVMWPTSQPAASSAEELEVVVEERDEDVETAALRLARLPQELFFADATKVKALLTGVATVEYFDAFEAELLPELADARRAMASATPASTWWVTVPLSIEVVQHSDTRAEASVWTVEMFSRDGVTDPELSFGLIDMALEADGPTSEWRLAKWSKGPGPAARLGVDASPVTAADLDAELDGHVLVPVPNKDEESS